MCLLRYLSVLTLHHVEAEPDYLAHELSSILLALSPLSSCRNCKCVQLLTRALGAQTKLRTYSVLFAWQMFFPLSHLPSTKIFFLNKVTSRVCSWTCIWEGESAVGEATKVAATGEMTSPRSQSEKVTRIGIGTQVLCLSCAFNLLRT